jgi:hypothetical protein
MLQPELDREQGESGSRSGGTFPAWFAYQAFFSPNSAAFPSWFNQVFECCRTPHAGSDSVPGGAP